jgi:MbtH protein
MPDQDEAEELEYSELEYSVVVNDEEQYSIWLTDADVPAGWHAVGVTGTKNKCLDYIEEVWTDMRPLSVRRWVEEARAASDYTGNETLS